MEYIRWRGLRAQLKTSGLRKRQSAELPQGKEKENNIHGKKDQKQSLITIVISQ